jgi:hypothetical protein
MDFLNLLYPQAFLVANAFAAGEMPLWNWYDWGGCPLLAGMQCAALYPPMWMTLLLPLPYCLHLNVLCHLVIAGSGAACLFRTAFNTGSPAALFAGIAYAGGGFFLGHIEQVNSVAAMSWVPWILVAAVRCTSGRKYMLLLSASVALGVLSGHPQHILLALLFTGFLLACIWASSMFPSASRPSPGALVVARRVLGFPVGVAVGFALCAAQILPSGELQGLSERVWPYEDPFSPALQWQNILALMVPRYYNRISGVDGQPLGYTELGLYCGLLTFPLFLAGAASIVRKRDAMGVSLLATWAFAMLFALGRSGTLAPLLLQVTPLLENMRGTARALNVATLLFAVIAGYGIEQVLWRSQFVRIARLRKQLAAMTIVALVADLSLTHTPELKSILADRRILDIRPSLPKFTSSTAGSASRLYRFMANDSDYYLDHRAQAVAQRIARLQPNLNALQGIPTIDGYEEGLHPSWRFANHLRAFNRNLRNSTLDAQLLALMGVNRVVSEYPLAMDTRHWEPCREGFSSGGVKYQIWRNCIPSAWLMDEVTLLSKSGGTPVLSAMRIPEENRLSNAPPVRETTGKQVAPHGFETLQASDFADAIRHSGMTAVPASVNRFRVRVTGTPSRNLVLTQAYYPGWKAFASAGKALAPEISVEPAGPFLTRVRVSSRVSHSIRDQGAFVLAYHPYSYRLGTFLSLASISGLLLGMHFASKRRNRTLSESLLDPKACASI